MRWRVAAALGVAMLLAAPACRGGGEAINPVVGATVATAPFEPPTTQPYDVPPIIDAAYVNRVLAGLDAAVGDAYRMYLKVRQMTPEIEARLKALYATEEGFSVAQRSLEIERDRVVTTEPGNQVTTVTRLITVGSSCVYAQVSRDYRPVGGTLADGTEWVGLQLAAGYTPRIAFYNPTGWQYVIDGFLRDRSQPPDPCTRS